MSTVDTDYGLKDRAPDFRRWCHYSLRDEQFDHLPLASHFQVEGTPDNPGKQRKIWRAKSLTPDPFNEGRFYLLQELAGEWRNDPTNKDESFEVSWHPVDKREPVVTRTIYAEMNRYGRMVNLFQDASQGQGSDPFSHLRGDGDV